MPIDAADLDPDPARQLAAWLAEAEAAGVRLPGAFALATADGAGAPSVRMVLLRTLDQRGLAFFTDRRSRKGRDLRANPRAAATFWWDSLDRQVRAAGRVEPLPREESAAYWSTRPPASRLSAWASVQGQPIGSRELLERRVAEIAARLGEDPPLPGHWGGYRLIPEAWEFWESRADRLHDRVEYRPRREGGWRCRRLQP
ncbi:MAG TPA: pyridoxamine 5'-phosphate oxidase [Candidatus Limnocylindria bacterium]|nr:pyridoxamine 5'-phosphate oxidase [Candidatus Limnocylindria bacterium]